MLALCSMIGADLQLLHNIPHMFEYTFFFCLLLLGHQLHGCNAIFHLFAPHVRLV